MDFNITREEVLELAATKLADQMADYEELQGLAMKITRQRIDEVFANTYSARIDAVLGETITKLIDETVTPRDIWGERLGPDTTIRHALATKAKDFWLTKVDAQGKETNYGGKPRWEQFLSNVSKEQFTKVIQENIDGIVQGFKEALRTDTAKLLAEHIEKLIPAKRR